MIELSNIKIILGIITALISISLVFRKEILYPLFKRINGYKLDLVNTSIDNNQIEIIVQNNEKRSIVISKIEMHLIQTFFIEQPGPSKLQLPISVDADFIIEKTDKVLSTNSALMIKNGEADRIRGSIRTGTGESRILEVYFKLYTGKKVCLTTDKSLLLIKEINTEIFEQNMKLEENKVILDKANRSKHLKSKELEETITNYLS